MREMIFKTGQAQQRNHFRVTFLAASGPYQPSLEAEAGIGQRVLPEIVLSLVSMGIGVEVNQLW